MRHSEPADIGGFVFWDGLSANGMTTTVSGFAPRWRTLILWIGPVALAIGFVAERLWRTFPASRALETILLAVIAMTIAWCVRRLSGMRMATAVASVFAAALIVFAGPLEILSAALLAAAAVCIGTSIGRGRPDAVTLLVGLSALTGVLGWLIPFPIHYRAIYVALLVVPIVLRRAQLASDVRGLARDWQAAIDASPHAATFAVLVIGLCSAGCWFPTLQYDDLAYHLGLPSQLSALHYYRLDAQSQIWALAPWSGDIAHGIAQLVAGREARGALDALWLLALMALVWRCCRLLGADATTRWLAVAIAASQPLLTVLAGGMQSELPATAAALGLVVIVLARDEVPPTADAMRFACVAALLFGLKTGFIAIVLPQLIVFAWSRRVRGFSGRTVAAVLVFLLLCGSSYFYAALLTGDPMFPLFADTFHSRYPVADMGDVRWRADIGASALWSLTFHTADYHEGWDGAAGFSLLGLAGASAMALFVRRTRVVATCASLAFIVAIATVHYFRYTFPAAVMLIAPSMTVLAQSLPLRHVVALTCALVAANLGYQSCASWILHVGGIKHRVMHTDARMFDRFAPTRDLLGAVEPGSNVLFCSPTEPANAELAGRGFTVAHYDTVLEHDRVAADADASGAAWRRLFQRTQARYAVVSLIAPENPALATGLADARLVREVGSRQLWQLPPQPTTEEDLARARDAARHFFWP